MASRRAGRARRTAWDVPRRCLGGTLLGLLIAVSVAWSARVQAAAEAETEPPPIRIGAVYIMSGPFGVYGEFARNGIQLAVERVNASGGVLGRKLEVILADSGGKANVAINAIRRLVSEDGVDLLMGIDSSGVARGVAPLMRTLRKPLLVTHAATPDLTGRLCNTWVFRNSVNIAQNMRAASAIAAGMPARRWTTIGPNYAFGHQSWEFFRGYLGSERPDASFLEPHFPTFGTPDFRPTIREVLAQRPEGVLVSLWGGDLIAFLRQAKELDFFGQDFEVMLTLGAAVEVLRALGPEMPEGVWAGTRYWYAGPESATNRDFVTAYKARFGAPPSYNSHNAYAAVFAYKQAIEAAGSLDAEAVAAALSGMAMTAPIGTFTFRAADHQATVDAFWGRTAGMTADGIRALDPVKVIPGESLIRAAEDTDCRLAR